MRYLAFDIECCDGKHICEFGYVIADDKFKILEKDIILINPESRFDLAERSGSKGLNLFFTKNQYYGSLPFTTYYNTIKALLEYPDQIVMGHALKSDAEFLRAACERYRLPHINFSFFDSQKAYSTYANINYSISLEDAANAMSIEKPEHLHKSDEDALLSLRLIRAMCQNSGIDFSLFADLYPGAFGRSKDGEICYKGDSLPEMLEALEKTPELLSRAQRRRCIKEFCLYLASVGATVKSRLSGKKYCFGQAFEENCTKKALFLMYLMRQHGSDYNPKVTDNDLFVATDDEMSNSQAGKGRIAAAYRKKSHGGRIKIMSFAELYTLLNVTEDMLKQMMLPSLEENWKQNIKALVPSTGDTASTIGDVLKAEGINLSCSCSDVAGGTSQMLFER